MKLIALIIAGSCIANLNPERLLGEYYHEAVKRIAEDDETISRAAHQYNQDPLLIKSIVFPEYIRYNLFSGLIEEQALEIGYVQLGCTAVDFSVGKFQIKPSFVEQLEREVVKYPTLRKKYKLLILENSTTAQARAVRVSRLKDVRWQTIYVCCMAECCREKYGIEGWSTSDELQFLATVYNAGLYRSREQVRSLFSNKAFPYGKKFLTPQVGYWEVSLDYYLKYRRHAE